MQESQLILIMLVRHRRRQRQLVEAAVPAHQLLQAAAAAPRQLPRVPLQVGDAAPEALTSRLLRPPLLPAPQAQLPLQLPLQVRYKCMLN